MDKSDHFYVLLKTGNYYANEKQSKIVSEEDAFNCLTAMVAKFCYSGKY